MGLGLKVCFDNVDAGEETAVRAATECPHHVLNAIAGCHGANGAVVQGVNVLEEPPFIRRVFGVFPAEVFGQKCSRVLVH